MKKEKKNKKTKQIEIMVIQWISLFSSSRKKTVIQIESLNIKWNSEIIAHELK